MAAVQGLPESNKRAYVAAAPRGTAPGLPPVRCNIQQYSPGNRALGLGLSSALQSMLLHALHRRHVHPARFVMPLKAQSSAAEGESCPRGNAIKGYAAWAGTSHESP